jgi:hypothetical protein
VGDRGRTRSKDFSRKKFSIFGDLMSMDARMA